MCIMYSANQPTGTSGRYIWQVGVDAVLNKAVLKGHLLTTNLMISS